jgi:transcriptional regulator with XRE-family HTH domain
VKFVKRIKQLREERQLPQRKLATTMYIDTATYCKIEEALTKTDCETAIENLENSEYMEFYSYLANDNQPLNDFLVSGNERIFVKFSQESIYKLPEFVSFISPYLAPRLDRTLLELFISLDIQPQRISSENILEYLNFCKQNDNTVQT